MKRTTDDIANWRLQQKNNAEPFPYVFSRMPPRFRRCRAFAKALLLLEWGCICVLFLGIIGAGAVMLFQGKELLLEEGAVLLICLVCVVDMPLFYLCRGLRHTPQFFWRCPCCGLPFPYYAPPLRGADDLKEADCLHSMEHLRIKYVKTRFCPLIIPSVCPEYKCKFFDMEHALSIKDE